jgi:murein DD-endopeptidase MepM/ murein hydrolase activator NlpD
MKKIIITESQLKRVIIERSTGYFSVSGSMNSDDPNEKLDLFDIDMGGEILQRWGGNGKKNVRRVQSMLILLGYDIGNYGHNKDGRDGIYGPYTKNGVIEFQKDVFADNNEWDGMVGPNTYEKLIEMVDEIAEAEAVDREELIDSVGSEEYISTDNEYDKSERKKGSIISIGGKKIKHPSKAHITSKPTKNRGNNPHHGYDIVANKDIFRKKGKVPLIICNKPGIVTYAKECTTYGNLVEIKHGDNDYSAYGHLKSINVSIGEYLDVGDIIGVEGKTGRVTGDHTHFEFRVDRPSGFKNRCGKGSPDVEVNKFANVRPISDVDDYFYYQTGEINLI